MSVGLGYIMKRRMLFYTLYTDFGSLKLCVEDKIHTRTELLRTDNFTETSSISIHVKLVYKNTYLIIVFVKSKSFMILLVYRQIYLPCILRKLINSRVKYCFIVVFLLCLIFRIAVKLFGIRYEWNELSKLNWFFINSCLLPAVRKRKSLTA